MNLTYNTFEKYSLAEISDLLRINQLYKKTDLGTRFKTIANSRDKFVLPNHGESSICVVDFFSGVVSYDGDKPIGILLFENYKYLEEYKNSIQHKYKKHSFINKGAIGIYVEEDYRKNNIANDMMQIFNKSFIKEFYNEIKDFDLVLLSCTSHCLKIASKQLVGIALTNSFGNPSRWKESIKNSLNYYTHESSFRMIKELYNLGGDLNSILDNVNDWNDNPIRKIQKNRKVLFNT